MVDTAATTEPEIIDYSDMGKSIQFKFGEKVYTIPTISRKKARILLSIGRKMDLSRPEEDKDKPLTDEEIEGLSKFQIEYITSVIPNVTEEEIDDWPSQMVNKVIELISNSISGRLGEEKKV